MNRLKDIFVVVFCLTGTLVSLNLFRLDLYQTIASQNAEPVGTVTIKNNNVQRRFTDRVLWGRLFVESPVHLGDLIRVAEHSGATLHIADNDIELNENTLIRILRSTDAEGRIIIDLGLGSVNIASGSGGGITLAVPGANLTTSPGTTISAAASPAAEGNTVTNAVTNTVTIEVIEGNAVLTAAGGQSVSLNAGEKLTLDIINNTETEHGKPEITLKKETIAAPLMPEPETESEQETELEPVPAVVSESAAEASASAAVVPPAGTPQAGTPQVSAPQAAAPALLAEPGNRRPANRHRIEFQEIRASRKIDFSWAAVPEANAYIFTLYHQGAGGRRQILRPDPLQRPAYTLDNLRLLEQGTFIWQVEAVIRNQNGVIEQRGRVAETIFIIDIPAPTLQESDVIEVHNAE